jgi:lipopolysaccharide biosynthesis glycosyltransferase/glycosyltransferase involved in cell wall biosynthesis
MESTTQPQDAATRRQLDIVNYETAVLTAEMALAEQTKQAPEAGIANLHDRPHVVYLLESRAAGIVITGLQHLAWALSHRLRFLRRRRAAAAPLPEFPPSETIAAYDRPALASVNFDASLLTRRPRILLDITPTARDPNARGGIPRVIAELARAGVETGLGWPVVIAEGGLRPYYTHPDLPDVVEPGPGDIYVIADIFWYFLPQYRRTVAMLRAAGAEIGLFVHDIFPLQFPSFYPAEVPPTFEAGLAEFLAASRYCITISRQVESEITGYFTATNPAVLEKLQIAVVPLGVAAHQATGGVPRPSFTALFDGGRTFLSVGTLEPRKGYDVTLDACELVWRQGGDLSLVITGRFGWRAQAVRRRIETHPEFGRRLFWLQDATDAELVYAYAHCRALIQSSIGEGFGLPIIEASRHGAPVIASDIEVFREIAGAAIDYYRVADAADLARQLKERLAAPRRPASLQAGTWADTMRAISVLVDNAAPPAPIIAPPPAQLHITGAGVVHVALCFDDAMAMPAAAVAASIAATTDDARVILHMLHPPGLSVDIGALQASLDSERFSIADHVIENNFTGLHATDQYTGAIYYRFMLPDLVPADRVIYIDSDTIVRRSLSGLYQLDLAGRPVGAMQDYTLFHHMRDHGMPIFYQGEGYDVGKYAREVLDLDLDATSYFNSGVLVMDLALWRARDIARRCLDFCRATGVLHMADQDALNHVLRGDFTRLDPRWNSFSYMYNEYHRAGDDGLPEIFGGYGRRLRKPAGEWAEILSAWAFDPWIVHFAFMSKPWVPGHRRTDYDSYFWANAFRTPFGGRLYDQMLQSNPAGATRALIRKSRALI